MTSSLTSGLSAARSPPSAKSGTMLVAFVVAYGILNLAPTETPTDAPVVDADLLRVEGEHIPANTTQADLQAQLSRVYKDADAKADIEKAKGLAAAKAVANAAVKELAAARAETARANAAAANATVDKITAETKAAKATNEAARATAEVKVWMPFVLLAMLLATMFTWYHRPTVELTEPGAAKDTAEVEAAKKAASDAEAAAEKAKVEAEAKAEENAKAALNAKAEAGAALNAAAKDKTRADAAAKAASDAEKRAADAEARELAATAEAAKLKAEAEKLKADVARLEKWRRYKTEQRELVAAVLPPSQEGSICSMHDTMSQVEKSAQAGYDDTVAIMQKAQIEAFTQRVTK